MLGLCTYSHSFHSRNSNFFSCACFYFALVGIPIHSVYRHLCQNPQACLLTAPVKSILTAHPPAILILLR